MIVELLAQLRANETVEGYISQGRTPDHDWQRLIDTKMIERRFKVWKYSAISQTYFFDTVEHDEYQATKRRQKHNFKGRVDWVITITGATVLRDGEPQLDPRVPPNPQPGTIDDPEAYANALVEGTLTKLLDPGVPPDPQPGTIEDPEAYANALRDGTLTELTPNGDDEDEDVGLAKPVWFTTSPGAAEAIDDRLSDLYGIGEVKKILRDHWEVRVDLIHEAADSLTKVILSKGKKLGIHASTLKALRKLRKAIQEKAAES